MRIEGERLDAQILLTFWVSRIAILITILITIFHKKNMDLLLVLFALVFKL
jgi:hypothetical protein